MSHLCGCALDQRARSLSQFATLSRALSQFAQLSRANHNATMALPGSPAGMLELFAAYTEEACSTQLDTQVDQMAPEGDDVALQGFKRVPLDQNHDSF